MADLFKRDDYYLTSKNFYYHKIRIGGVASRSFFVVSDIDKTLKEIWGENKSDPVQKFNEPSHLAPDLYGSAIIVPIKGKLIESVQNKMRELGRPYSTYADEMIIGYLCVDSKDKEVFIDSPRSYDVYVCQQVATIAFNALHSFDGAVNLLR